MASAGRVLIIDLNESLEYQKLLDGPPQTYGMRSGRVYLNPGQSCGRHSTKNNEEILIFISGRGQLLIGESVSFCIGKGKISYIPPDTVHDVKNSGEEPLIYIYCVVPINLI
jgi:mannose-6-phosphate isomerase-like protein (cupin superfamily)